MKTPIPIHLAVEDDLSESILRRVLRERPADYAVGPVFKRGGFGFLKKQSPAFNNMAKACPPHHAAPTNIYPTPGNGRVSMPGIFR